MFVTSGSRRVAAHSPALQEIQASEVPSLSWPLVVSPFFVYTWGGTVYLNIIKNIHIYINMLDFVQTYINIYYVYECTNTLHKFT